MILDAMVLCAAFAVQAAGAQGAQPAELPAGAPPGIASVEREGLRTHAMWLAADARAGRYTGTPGQVEAADYIAAHFARLGLQPLGDKKGFLQRYPVVVSRLDAKSQLAVGDETWKDGFAVVPGKDTKRVAVRGSLAFAEYGSPQALDGRLDGKIPFVVARPREAQERQAMAARRDLLKLWAIAKEAERRGAGVLVVGLTSDDDGLADALNYSALLPQKPIVGYGHDGAEVERPVPIPVVVTCSAVTAKILAALGVARRDDGGFDGAPRKVAGRVALQVEVDRKATAVNVVARLPGAGGSLAQEAVVVSAHMDHMGTRLDGAVFNGADDNASGTAGLLEIAEAFATCTAKPKRSIVFLSVSGEELGLYGSRWFADNPTWPLSRIVADVNIDMIGRDGDLSNATQVSLTPSHAHDAFSSLVRDAAGFAAQLGLEPTNGDKYYERSDHYNFATRGVPVVFFCDGEHADYHRVTDDPDRLDYAKMERIARLAYWTARATADASAPPERLGQRKAWRE